MDFNLIHITPRTIQCSMEFWGSERRQEGVNTKRGHLGLKTGFLHFSAHANMIERLKHQQYITFGIDGQPHVLILGPFIVVCVQQVNNHTKWGVLGYGTLYYCPPTSRTQAQSPKVWPSHKPYAYEAQIMPSDWDFIYVLIEQYTRKCRKWP